MRSGDVVEEVPHQVIENEDEIISETDRSLSSPAEHSNSNWQNIQAAVPKPIVRPHDDFDQIQEDVADGETNQQNGAFSKQAPGPFIFKTDKQLNSSKSLVQQSEQ